MTWGLPGSMAEGMVTNLISTAANYPRQWEVDLVIIGGGLGGCAAALSASRNGLKVVMTEETDWIGGQLTSQAVPPDENPWIESFGGTKSYSTLRNKIRDYYRRHYRLSHKGAGQEFFNPGNGWVSRLCHEPRVALAVLNEMLAPYVAQGTLQILLKHKPVMAGTDGDRVRSVTVLDLESGIERILLAKYFADATELGDLLPMTGAEFVTGAESNKETGERHAPEKAMPEAQQGFTVCFGMDYLAGEDHTIIKPADYEFWRGYKRNSTSEEEPPLFNFTEPSQKQIGFDPVARTGYWSYRRIIDFTNFETNTFPGDVTIVNWGQNDYSLGNLLESATRQTHISHAKQQSLSLLYWLQTEAPRPDGGSGWKGLRLRPDIVGTLDGLAKYPYIRESRRIRAEFTVLEQHVSTRSRMRETNNFTDSVTAADFSDSIGIGAYKIDVHANTGGGRGLYMSTVPFQIPLGSLIPMRLENLLPACKNIGVTHITNGCYRLHPVEWNVGESVGELVAMCVQKKLLPREVRNKKRLLTDFQTQLSHNGIPLGWPKGKIKPL
jgi:hypothetical protein